MSEFTKYIDSVVGNIARKIEDEFNENDHPRDKGGKFTSKGGEGKGGLHHAGKDVEEYGNKLKSKHKENINRLKEIASDGFSEYPEMAQDFLKTMGVKLPKLSREEKEYYEEYPDEYQDLIMEKVHAAIKRDPEAAKEALGEWADED